MTHTSNESNPMWQVDIGSDTYIGDITIFNRTDACCIHRLTYFTVSVINEAGNTTFSESFSAYPDPSITVDAGSALGHIVRVQLDDSYDLSLAEVQVFAGEEPIGQTPEPGNSLVHMQKRNASDFAIDGNHDGADGQNIYLWAADANNVNQQWIEIDRGNGYYSYQKADTDYCIDGNHGGENGQSVYLWTCVDGNENQHWRKVDAGAGSYRLEKRNAPGFSINAGNGGANLQDIYLSESQSDNQNQHWIVTGADR